ncbi:hypothetical protein UlMin_006911 [Ulmus minor]
MFRIETLNQQSCIQNLSSGHYGFVVLHFGILPSASYKQCIVLVLKPKLPSTMQTPQAVGYEVGGVDIKELSCIVLGDRPIEITISWNTFRWTEKHNLVLSVVRGITSPLLDYKDNGTFQLYEQLSFSYPSLLDLLIHERDTCLVSSLKGSKAVNKSKGVVGVIGKGHMNGVIYALTSYQGNLCFRDLLGGKRPSANASNGWIGRLLNSLIRDTIIGFLLWELYEQIKGHHHWTMFYMTQLTRHL